MDVDPDRVRELALSTGKHATAIGAQRPLSDGNDAAAGAKGCEIAANVRDAARSLDTVLGYHVTRLNHFADLARRAADNYEVTDEQNRRGFGK